MDTNLVLEGLKFMFLGMGTVFVFLITLIILMNIMSALVHKFFPEPVQSVSSKKTQQENNKNNKIIAAISAAISHHRRG